MGDVMYYTGTLEEFNSWHDEVKIAEGIPPEGKIGYVNGLPAPDNQRTYAYSEATLHPQNVNSYIWAYGDYPDAQKVSISKSQAIELGYFSGGI